MTESTTYVHINRYTRVLAENKLFINPTHTTHKQKLRNSSLNRATPRCKDDLVSMTTAPLKVKSYL